MKFRRRGPGDDKVDLPMTPMIDIVFLLLIFFVMTFRIGAQEGDFNVKMPLQGDGAQVDTTLLPLKLRLISDGNGNLREIVLNDSQSFGRDFNSLRGTVIALVGDEAGPTGDEGPEVEIDVDYDLRYTHLIEGITSVTGYRRGNDIIHLIDRIKFAPPRQ